MANPLILPTQGEILFRRCEKLLMMNPLMMNNYYTMLFASFGAFLMEEHRLMLEYQVKDIEGWLSDNLNQLSLQEAETRMFSNMDLLSGFEVRGEMITQLMINEKLEKIKTWLQGLLYQMMPFVRFTQPLAVE